MKLHQGRCPTYIPTNHMNTPTRLVAMQAEKRCLAGHSYKHQVSHCCCCCQVAYSYCCRCCCYKCQAADSGQQCQATRTVAAVVAINVKLLTVVNNVNTGKPFQHKRDLLHGFSLLLLQPLDQALHGRYHILSLLHLPCSGLHICDSLCIVPKQHMQQILQSGLWECVLQLRRMHTEPHAYTQEHAYIRYAEVQAYARYARAHA